MSNETPEQIAAKLAAPFEGFSTKPYWDALGRRWTIGYGSVWVGGDGHTPVTANTALISQAAAQVWLANELRLTAAGIMHVVKVELTDNEAAALDDLVYNIGIGAFRSSTLLRRLNAGDYEGAAQEILRWDHAGSKVIAGLLRRRQAETALFETPDQSTGQS